MTENDKKAIRHIVKIGASEPFIYNGFICASNKESGEIICWTPFEEYRIKIQEETK